MPETLTIDFRKPMAVFPLQDCVLFPHTLLPLHIFESRYREMVTDSLDQLGLIAMALFEKKVSQEEYLEGRPALSPIVCVGHIRQYEHLEDGRYLLVLQDLCRARITSEVPHGPYRTMLLAPIPEKVSDFDDLKEAERRIQDLLRDSLVGNIPEIEELARHGEALPPEALTDVISAAVFTDAESRYDLLAEPDINVRAASLIHRLELMSAGPSPN